MTATITIERPGHPHADELGGIKIWVDGDVGRIEAPSRHCPGDPGEVGVHPGPFEVKWRTGLTCGATIDTELCRAEEQDAKDAIREAAYDELRGTAQGRRILRGM